MKQGVIAFLVVLAGCFGVFVVLGVEPPPADSATASSVAPGSEPQADARHGFVVSRADEPSKGDRVAPDETASMETSAEPVSLPSLTDTAPLAAPSEAFLSGIRALSSRDSLTAITWRDRLPPGSVEWHTLTWAIAVSGQAAVPSTLLYEARSALSDWPGQSIMRENLEEALYRENAPPELILKELGGQAPVTADGAIMLARAALSSADGKRAADTIRLLWTRHRLDPETEERILAEFGHLLSRSDHKRRMEFLLYDERYDDAGRFAERAEAESLYKAFVAVGRNARNADKQILAVDASWRDDPAFLYLRAKRQRQLRNYAAAAALLEKAPRQAEAMVDPGAWWVETRIVSRGLMDEGDARRAYELAAAHRATDASDRAEAEFHAGWYALRGLRDTSKAERHFKALLAASARGHDQARALYWLGRTAQTRKDANATALYKRAARFPATFYGQLAAGRLGDMVQPGSIYTVTDADRMAFSARPEVRGISLLEQAGEPSRARRLYLALAASLESPVELQLLAEKALADHGPTLALAIGKTALRQGHDPGLAAFPLGAIPDSADVSGAGKALAYAIARQESAFNPQAVSPANARGLLQLLPSTAERVASKYRMAYAEEKLTSDPAFNATLGSHYLGEQIDKFDGSLIMTFAAYNAGPSRVNQWVKRYGDPRGRALDEVIDWIERIPFTETRDYVQRVMENYQVYKMLLDEKADIVADLGAAR